MTTQAEKTLTMIREVCALGRAEFERPRTPEGDPDAGRALVEGLQALDQDGNPSDIALSLDLLAPRAPYFDQLVLDAIDNGIRQIVNLGAGYDDRALRFRRHDVRYFDLDLPEIIADKADRLTGLNMSGSTLVTVDFSADDVEAVLDRAGHDAQQPTLFLAEHLVLFLAPDDVTRLITGVSRRAAHGSVLALTAEVHPAGLDSALVVSTVDKVMFAGAGPLRTITSLDTWLTLLTQHGWTVHDPATITAVTHFELPVNDLPTPIQTHFLTATV